MSVTFSIESNRTGSYSASCFNGGQIAAGVHQGIAVAAIAAHVAECAECAEYAPWLHADTDIDGSEVNMANANARKIMLALDLDHEDMCGVEDGAVFLARVLVALGADRDDHAVPGFEDHGTGGAVVIYCGTPAGYVTARLHELHDLAVEAARLGRSINWA